MEKSIIIKSPSIVTDTSLKKMNEVQFSVNETWASSPSDGSYNMLTVKGDAASMNGRKIRIVGDAHFTNATRTEDYGQEVTLANVSTNQSFYISGGKGVILADIREQATYFAPPFGRDVHLSGDVNYMPNLVGFNYVSVTFDDGLSFDVNLKLTDIRISSKNNPEIITLSPEDFDSFTTLDTLSLGHSDTFGVVGDIEDFGQFSRLGLLRLSGNTGVTGTAESLFDKMYENGRKSGQIKAYLENTSVTYDEVACSSVLTVNFNANGWYLVT